MTQNTDTLPSLLPSARRLAEEFAAAFTPGDRQGLVDTIEEAFEWLQARSEARTPPPSTDTELVDYAREVQALTTQESLTAMSGGDGMVRLNAGDANRLATAYLNLSTRTNDPSNGEAVERPWQPHERNYSGGRFGVWHDEKWTMLRVEAGVGDVTASIKDHEAWDLATRLSPALAKRMEYLFAEMRKAQDALHQFTWAATLSPLLRKIADEWDCDSSVCEFASSDMGGLSCPKIEGEDGCHAVEAEELRQFATALETRAALSTPAPNPETVDVDEIVKQAGKPWWSYHGPLPDYDHPLRPVYESGIQYAVELLAKELGVEDWEICDGTEEFDGDLGGTLLNIVKETWPTDEHGDWIDLREPANRIAPNPDPIVGERTFQLGDRVTKRKGSSWTGRIVGTYSTALTPEGYAVESENELGSVQIYPAAALAAAQHGGE